MEIGDAKKGKEIKFVLGLHGDSERPCWRCDDLMAFGAMLIAQELLSVNEN